VEAFHHLDKATFSVCSFAFEDTKRRCVAWQKQGPTATDNKGRGLQELLNAE
jgi:hypothetical protein